MPTCGVCGQPNPAEARFCMTCAAPLAEAVPAGQARKTVTVVFCDVVDSTPLGDSLDPEAVRRVMTTFFAEMRAVLERHGGVVEKYIGDAVMAVFGVPTLHEDDALRAIRAAIDMRSALVALNEGFERTGGVSIATRTGVNTGEVVVGGGGGGPNVVGDAVNVAARLQHAAAPGEILLGRDTYRLVREFVSAEPLPSLALKGKAEPVTAYRLVELTRGFSEPPVRAEPRLVGRSEELRLLRGVFDQAVHDRACRLVTVIGAAGAGKSRLAREFLSGLEEDAVSAAGRCLPYGEGITFWPMAVVIRQLAGIELDDPLETARAKLEALLLGAEDSALLVDRVAAVTGLAGATEGMQETFWAIRRLLEWVGRTRPLVVSFDDLQWAEQAFLDLLDNLQRSCRDAPILLVCLARNDLLEERPEWAAQLPSASTVHLPPLRHEEEAALIDDLLQGQRLDEELLERIREVGGGNPLFIEEMLQMLRDDGLLGGAEAIVGPTRGTLSVPPTINALVGARLDRLSGEERAVIRAAAVMGALFWWGAVAELVPEELRESVGSILQSLVRRELIAPARTAFVGEDAYRFHHIVIQDAAYRETPKEVRAGLHARFAAWLERTAGDRIGEYEEIVAFHLERAARSLSELGRSEAAAKLAGRASDALAHAGRRAFARGDISAANNLLGRAFDILPEEVPRRLALMPDLGRAQTEAGDLAGAEKTLTEAVRRASETGARGLQAHAEIALLLLKESTDPDHRFEQAMATLESVIPVLEQLGDDLGLSRAWRLMADVHWARGAYATVERAAERSIEHARRAGDIWEASDALRLYAGSGLYGPALVDDVIRRCEQIMSDAKGHRGVEAGALRTLAAMRAMQGRFDEGRALARRSGQIMLDLGYRLRAMFATEVAGFIEMLAGDPVAAERELRVGYEFSESLGDRGWWATMAATLAHPVAAQGRLEEAEEFCRIAAGLGADDDLTTQVLWRSARAKVRSARGRSDDAARLGREAVEIAGRTDDINLLADTLIDLASVLRSTGPSSEADEAVRRALELYTRKGNVVSAARAEPLAAGGA